MPAVRGDFAPRKPNSIVRTWALIVAASIFTSPPTSLPITRHILGAVQSDTIMSGVLYFIKTGMWPIALVIFVASVFVPMPAIMLTFWSSRFSRDGVAAEGPHPHLPHHRSRRPLVHGRHLRRDHPGGPGQPGRPGQHQAGPAAVHFGAVVVITMFAAMSFDLA
jgi:paraquat-inducible protein A